MSVDTVSASEPVIMNRTNHGRRLPSMALQLASAFILLLWHFTYQLLSLLRRLNAEFAHQTQKFALHIIKLRSV